MRLVYAFSFLSLLFATILLIGCDKGDDDNVTVVAGGTNPGTLDFSGTYQGYACPYLVNQGTQISATVTRNMLGPKHYNIDFQLGPCNGPPDLVVEIDTIFTTDNTYAAFHVVSFTPTDSIADFWIDTGNFTQFGEDYIYPYERGFYFEYGFESSGGLVAPGELPATFLMP